MPEFSEKKLKLISKKMQSLCDMGFYNDMAWEVGTSCSGKRKIIFKDFLGKSDVKANEDSIVLHCLPAYRNKEITDEVIESQKSKVFEQAENRMHVQQALLSCLLS